MGYYLTDETVEPPRQTASIRDRACEPKTAYIGFCCMGNINQYVFCNNNPVNFVDPDGTTTWSVALPWIGEGGSAAGGGVLSGLGPAGAIAGAGMIGWTIGDIIRDPLINTGEWLGKQIGDLITPMKPHTKGARPSTKNKHEDGDARRARDRSGEDGDISRRPPRRRPDQWKGPWPPKEWNSFPFPPNNPFDDGQSSSCGGK